MDIPDHATITLARPLRYSDDCRDGFLRIPMRFASIWRVAAASCFTYWNFGIPGVLVGMYVIGRFIGQLWSMAGDDPRTKPLHLLLYILLMVNMPNMAEAVATIVGFVAMYLVFRFLFEFFEIPMPRHSAMSQPEGFRA